MTNMPLYFVAERTVLKNNLSLFTVDDGRMPLAPDKKIMRRVLCFINLGCYSFTSAIKSAKYFIIQILQRILLGATSESYGRIIDYHSAGLIEKKKWESHF